MKLTKDINNRVDDLYNILFVYDYCGTNRAIIKQEVFGIEIDKSKKTDDKNILFRLFKTENKYAYSQPTVIEKLSTAAKNLKLHNIEDIKDLRCDLDKAKWKANEIKNFDIDSNNDIVQNLITKPDIEDIWSYRAISFLFVFVNCNTKRITKPGAIRAVKRLLDLFKIDDNNPIHEKTIRRITDEKENKLTIQYLSGIIENIIEHIDSPGIEAFFNERLFSTFTFWKNDRTKELIVLKSISNGKFSLLAGIKTDRNNQKTDEVIIIEHYISYNNASKTLPCEFDKDFNSMTIKGKQTFVLVKHLDTLPSTLIHETLKNAYEHYIKVGVSDKIILEGYPKLIKETDYMVESVNMTYLTNCTNGSTTRNLTIIVLEKQSNLVQYVLDDECTKGLIQPGIGKITSCKMIEIMWHYNRNMNKQYFLLNDCCFIPINVFYRQE